MSGERKTGGVSASLLKGGRPVVGLIADDIVMVGGQNALRGVADAARERGVDLLCFHQRLFQGGEDQPIEMGPASWDTLAEAVDGLVVYQAWPNEETFAAFRGRFPSLPMANALRVYEGCPGLAPDAYRGMKELTCHLIQVHGSRRIVFVAGPEGNWAVQERYRGYVDALAEHDLPLDPNLVTPHLGWGEAEREAISLLLDERKLKPGADFEAVVTSNDSIALSMLAEFQSRGVRVPDEVAVVGFDDDSRAACSAPPLTTTRLPSYEIGRQAVEVVLAQIAGEQVPDRTLVPTKMIVRRSCGCRSLAVAQAAMKPEMSAPKGLELGDVFKAQRARILSIMIQVLEEGGAEGVVAEWVEQVLSGFAAEIEGGAPGTFLAALEDVLGQVMALGGDDLAGLGQRVAAWQRAVSVLRRWALPFLKGDAGIHAGDLWQQARVMIAVMAEQAQTRQALQIEQQAAALREVNRALITMFDVGGLIDALAGGLSQLGIPSAYLSLYENPERPDERARLMLAYSDEGRVELAADGLRFPSPQLMPEGMWPERRYSFMISPLFLQDVQLGFILCEMGPQEGAVYDTLRAQISNALQGALLVQRLRERSAELARQQYILDTFMENVPDRIYFKDLEGRVTRANQAHAVRMGLSGPAEEIGKSDFDFFPEEQARARYEQEQEIIRTGEPILNMEETDGLGQWSLVTKMPLQNEGGEIIGTFGISRDITEVKLVQAELEKAYVEVEELIRERTTQLEQEMAERERAQAENLQLQQDVIEAQQRSIQELSTPVIPVVEGVIVMPLIGSIDTLRARDITRRLLQGIREHRARVVILDLTGVPIVDSGVASHLNKTVQTARLKGARTIVTGLTEAVAETVVDLGIDWSRVETRRDLQTGLRTVLAEIEKESGK